jgi:hypothetical protein
VGRRLEDLDAALQHMRSEADAWRADARAGLERLLDIAGAVGRLESKIDEAVPHIARIEATFTRLAPQSAAAAGVSLQAPPAGGGHPAAAAAAAAAAANSRRLRPSGGSEEWGEAAAVNDRRLRPSGGSEEWGAGSSMAGSTAAGGSLRPRRARGGSKPKKKASGRPGGEALPEVGREAEPPAAPQQPGPPSRARADGRPGGLSVLGDGVLAVQGSVRSGHPPPPPSDTFETPARLAEEDRHILTGIERHVQRIAGSMGLYGGVSIGDDNEDRKRLKEKLKAALDRQTRTIVQEQEDWIEYIFGICKPDGRVGKRGSRCCLAECVWFLGCSMHCKVPVRDFTKF